MALYLFNTNFSSLYSTTTFVLLEDFGGHPRTRIVCTKTWSLFMAPCTHTRIISSSFASLIVVAWHIAGQMVTYIHSRFSYHGFSGLWRSWCNGWLLYFFLSHHLCTQISVVQYKAGSIILFFWKDSIPVSPGMFKSRYPPNTGCLFFPASTNSIFASTLQASSR
jgi:hypothetical protein